MKHSIRLRSLLAVFWLPVLAASAASQWDIFGSFNNVEFGRDVTVLPNGNFVVTDPGFIAGGTEVSAGAAYLYSVDGQLISTLTGSTANDSIGNAGVQVLANGNFVVRSSGWDNGAAINAGAVTWGSASTGFIGGPSVVVSAANSLVGGSSYDTVGSKVVTILSNGNYVVSTDSWDDVAPDVGAVTWGNGATGTKGLVSSGNSLVGSSDGDTVGGGDIVVLTNGNYVVLSSTWDGAFADVGAVTWCNGSNGFPAGESSAGAVVSSANSLVGGTADDTIGVSGVTALTNGNYVVASYLWDEPTAPLTDAGAVTWCDGSTGRTGSVKATNSLVGVRALDQVGDSGVTALTNGNYVVRSSMWVNSTVITFPSTGAATWCDGSTGIPAAETSPGAAVAVTNSLVGTRDLDGVGSVEVIALTNGNYVVCVPTWDNPATGVADVGAAVWGNGTSGITGAISAANALIGSSAFDHVGNWGGVPLNNGNYVIRSPNWNNGGADGAGAATWGNGSTGVKGVVSAANSLIGGSDDDNVSERGVVTLANGNYVVISPSWDPPASAVLDAGAATWGSGTSGVKGLISVANSLVGATTHDLIGNSGVTALTNGHYVVSSPNWNNPSGLLNAAGATTWGNGSSGVKGIVSAANSLIGTTTNDYVGGGGVTSLINGNYVVNSSSWSNPVGPVFGVGAITWGSGSAGVKGVISAANSLVGSIDSDFIGYTGVTALPNGNYVFVSEQWDDPTEGNTDSGAVTLGNGAGGTTGPIVAANSVLGTAISGGNDLTFSFDPAREQLIVGRRAENTVTRMGNLLRGLAKTGTAAPGALDIGFGPPATAAVNEDGAVLADFTLTGAGSTGGRNKALFGTPVFGGATDLVMQSGDNLSSLGGGLPPNTKAGAFSGHVTHQIGRGLFFATVSGTGITTSSNTVLLRDNGSSVSLLRRTGQFLPALGMPSTFREVVQNHDHDLLVLSYQLKASTTAPVVSATSDTGLLPLTHGGSIISANILAREGQAAFGGAGVFGEFTGRAVAGRDTTIHFAAALKTGATSVAALFRMTEDGFTTARTARVGDPAPGAAPATFASFPALGQTSERALFKATLSGGPATQNEGLWREGEVTYLVRKGVTEVLPGVKVASIIRFWPGRQDQVVFHATLSGTGVTTANNEALVLLQNDGAFLVLLRKDTSPPGIGTAKILAISAMDVDPLNGAYAVLTTLSGAPADSNQALWTGATSFGNDTSKQFRRLPQLRLRKGDHYNTAATPLGLVKSIVLKPAVDATGAGGRGLAQAIGHFGHLVICIIGADGQTELVVLPQVIVPI